MRRNPREHGLPNPFRVIGKPKVTALDEVLLAAIKAEGGCSNCGCETLFQIEVEVDLGLEGFDPLFHCGDYDCPPFGHSPSCPLVSAKPRIGIGLYMGCPACPWASPMMTRRKP